MTRRKLRCYLWSGFLFIGNKLQPHAQGLQMYCVEMGRAVTDRDFPTKACRDA